MSAFTAVVMNDGDAVPVTFSPSNIENGVAKYFETADVFDARRSISSSIRLPSKGSQVARVQLKVVIPVMDETVTTLKVGECIANLEFVIPKRATLANRKDILAFAANFLATAGAIASIENLESVY